jgi:hypothetical protein
VSVQKNTWPVIFSDRMEENCGPVIFSDRMEEENCGPVNGYHHHHPIVKEETKPDPDCLEEKADVPR